MHGENYRFNFWLTFVFVLEIISFCQNLWKRKGFDKEFQKYDEHDTVWKV